MRAFTRVVWRYRSLFIIILTPLLLLPLPLVINTKVAQCAFTLVLMAVFWMTEALPLAVTALLPAFLFPLFGIMKSSVVATMYFKDFHLLLLGIICLATSTEKWGLHWRIALGLVIVVGVNPGMLMLGFMVGCAFLSMWLSNTCTVAMVMPIVEAVMQQVMNAKDQVSSQKDIAVNGICNLAVQLEGDAEKECERDAKDQNSTGAVLQEIITEEDHPTEALPSPPLHSNYRTHQDQLMCKSLSLSIAYSANIGGLATLPGTSSNLVFAEYIHQFYPECKSVNFGNWFIFCLPVCIIILILAWIWLHWLFLDSNFCSTLCSRRHQSERDIAVSKHIKEQYNALGSMSQEEMITLVIFVLMAVLWFTREPGFMPGWASLFPDYPGYATDATVALLLGMLFFIIPAKRSTADNYDAMISWKEFQACMPWESCLLVGGGFALAEGTKVSGLSTWIAELMSPLGNLPTLVIVTTACLIVTSITEVASNAATITIFLPILASLAEAISINPLYMLIPATVSVSFSFLFPISNPPNAIVFAYGHIKTIDMVKAGLGLNVIGVLSVLLAISTWGRPIFDLDTYPDWAPVYDMTNTTQF
ncbi:solute carrier family 13 member 1 [Neoarius graeffei]|uniref:solute carrier family 13 member 1 n=1 Tax=Neoarius graeffei TaxID=443677 RepID=UPI00298CDBCB|nr:solute carrier family 13 member 1 [Neoarius graeffei]